MTKKNKEVAICSIPAYCVRTLGCRHILIGGGGGSAKTGVPNELQLFLLGYNSNFDLKNSNFVSSAKIAAQLNKSVTTDEFANMNMDCIALTNEPPKGLYLIAVGQDEFCAFYETTGFCLSGLDTGDVEHHLAVPSTLTLEFRSLIRVETDKYPGDDSYQKCVRLFRTSNDSIKMLTAGTDGYVRLWSTANLLKNIRAKSKEEGKAETEIPIRRDVTPELEICTGKNGVEDIDISPCGTVLGTVLPHQTILWDLGNFGKQLAELPSMEEEGKAEVMTKKFKVRTLRFCRFNKTGSNIVFVTIHNQRIRSSKEVSHLALWIYDKGTGGCRMLRTNKAATESVSCLELSDCGHFVAIGTMGGSIGLFDTQSLTSLLFIPQAHSSFVTALSFLPQKAYDIKDLGRIGECKVDNLPAGKCFLPGICASSRAAVVSISVDRTVQVHQLPYTMQNSLSGFLLRLSLFVSVFYIIFWSLFIRQ